VKATPVDLVAGAFWSLSYLLIIKRGFQDKACGMPVLALCSNFGWELLALTFRVRPEILPGAYMWVPPDAIMFVQCLLYGPRDFAQPFIARYFRPIVVATFAYGFALTYFFEVRLGDDHRYYSAYLGNLAMSALFIAMLLRRGSSRGQSMYIAITKLLGTAIVSVECLRLHRDPEPALLGLLAAGIFALDVLYAVLLARQLREEGVSPWARA
jgi:hypothetical protein